MKNKMYPINIYSNVSTDDGIGGTTIVSTLSKTISGIIDMLGKTDKQVANCFTVESTHILLTYDNSFTMDDRGNIAELDNLKYEIMYVDKPLHFSGKKYHVEIYLKVLGN